MRTEWLGMNVYVSGRTVRTVGKSLSPGPRLPPPRPPGEERRRWSSTNWIHYAAEGGKGAVGGWPGEVNVEARGELEKRWMRREEGGGDGASPLKG